MCQHVLWLLFYDVCCLLCCYAVAAPAVAAAAVLVSAMFECARVLTLSGSPGASGRCWSLCGVCLDDLKLCD